MMKHILWILIIICLTGCQQSLEPNQELRHKYFLECLEKCPAGPQSVKYNDWDEVVKACETAAYYQSLR